MDDDCKLDSFFEYIVDKWSLRLYIEMSLPTREHHYRIYHLHLYPYIPNVTF